MKEDTLSGLLRITVFIIVWYAILTLTWNSKAHLVAFVPSFLVKLWKWIAHWCIIFCTIAEDVNSKIECMTEW